MKKLLLLNLLLLFVFRAQAQKDFRPGYIVNLQGDTLKGEVNFKGDINNAQECTFRAGESAAEQNFKPGQLSGYGFTGGKIYEAKTARIVNRQFSKLNNQLEVVPVAGSDSVNFMQVLVKGTASLYFMKDATSAPHYFLQHRQNRLQELVFLKAFITDPKTGVKQNYQSKLYVGVLKNAFGDCPQIMPDIEKTGYKNSDLEKLFNDYNQCVSPGNTVFVSRKPRAVTTWGPLVGVSFSKLTIVYQDNFLEAGDYSSKPAPTAGLFLDLPIPAVNEKLSINNAVYYTTRHYSADYYYRNSDLYQSNYRVALKFTNLRLENALRYTAPGRTFQPFGQAGISNTLMLSGDEHIESTKYYLDYPPEDRQEPDYLTPIFRKHQLGFVGGAGVKYVLSNGKQLILQANYEFNTGFTKGVGVASNSHNAAILLGIGL